MSVMTYFACFDVGGTYIKYGLVSEEGALFFSDQCLTPKGQPEALASLLCDIVRMLQRQVNVISLGIAIHGVVDVDKGQIICGSPFVATWVDFPFVDYLQKQLTLPVFMENDVNAAALGERWKGASCQFSNTAFLTLGSSIGGALIINGQLYRGRNFCAGEFGYLITDSQEKDSSAFMQGSWERKASASVLLRQYKKMTGNMQVTEEQFQQALINNEAGAEIIFSQFLQSVTSGLASIAHMFAPDSIVIGGAITRMGDRFLKPLTLLFDQRVLSVCRGTDIRLAVLGNNAALIGMGFVGIQGMFRRTKTAENNVYSIS